MGKIDRGGFFDLRELSAVKPRTSHGACLEGEGDTFARFQMYFYII